MRQESQLEVWAKTSLGKWIALQEIKRREQLVRSQCCPVPEWYAVLQEQRQSLQIQTDISLVITAILSIGEIGQWLLAS